MSMILITPLSAIEETIRLRAPSHMVTLLSKDYMIDTPKGFPANRHLRLSMHDIADESYPGAPARNHIDQLLAFGHDWDAVAPMLIHCWAGVSRSTAAAFTLLCDRAGPGAEQDIAWLLRERAPHAQPNRLLVRLADEAMGRNGAMVRAIDSLGSGVLVTEGVPVEIPLGRP
jgi:predicted protein tyrosine phosphatase